MFDYLIVGAGFAGSVLAERLASRYNKRVLLVERRNHVGGNAYDYYNEHGILVHKYGPHIFHTNNKKVWDYLSTFTEWYYYQHQVLAYVDGNYVPFPVNLDTINILHGYSLSVENLEGYISAQKAQVDVNNIKNARDMAISRVGQDCYEKFFKNYTKKQWNLWPEELAAEVTARIPVRYSRDGRYFTDRYQGIPKYGYTKMFEKMLDHPNISILLNADYKEIVGEFNYDRLIYTGPIDYFFEYKHGRLPYRSLRFEMETLPLEKYQEAGTVNYPNDYDFTRVTEYKYLTGQRHSWTTIMREYPVADGEPYYPIPRPANQEMYQKYYEEVQKLSGKIWFIGRLAEYRYYNMDVVVEKAIKVFDEIE